MAEIWSGGPTVDEIKQEIAEKYISQRWHPRYPKVPLQILNYTPKRIYSGEWTEASMVCRGLILDDEFEVVHRPFRKFFNLGEKHGPEVDLSRPYRVFEKMDGCLGILYFDECGLPCIATRGSFTSWQALAATRFIQSFNLTEEDWPSGYTFLFEYIHPENRIVVDYGDVEQLVTLAAIETATGRSVDLIDIINPDPFPFVQEHRLEPHELEWDRPNCEGYVLLFDDDTRVKVKHDEYVYLHRLVTGLTPRGIWKMMAGGITPKEIADDGPEQFKDWLREISDDIQRRFNEILEICRDDFDARPVTDDRKEIALYFQDCGYPGVLFAMLDDKPYDDIIWKHVKPGAADPFRVEV